MMCLDAAPTTRPRPRWGRLCALPLAIVAAGILTARLGRSSALEALVQTGVVLAAVAVMLRWVRANAGRIADAHRCACARRARGATLRG